MSEPEKTLPRTCGKCPNAGTLMCCDRRVPLSLAVQFDKRKKPPEWCPLRKMEVTHG